MLAHIEEECETLSAQIQEASLTSLNSVWLFQSITKCFPKQLSTDSHKTLFQLKEYHLLHPLYVYVETEALLAKDNGRIKDNAASKKRPSDILNFVKLVKGNEYEFVGSVTLLANSSTRDLVEKAKMLVKETASVSKPNLIFEILPAGTTFDSKTIPGGGVENGNIVIIKKEMEHKLVNAEKINEFKPTISTKGVRKGFFQ